MFLENRCESSRHSLGLGSPGMTFVCLSGNLLSRGTGTDSESRFFDSGTGLTSTMHFLRASRIRASFSEENDVVFIGDSSGCRWR